MGKQNLEISGREQKQLFSTNLHAVSPVANLLDALFIGPPTRHENSIRREKNPKARHE
jgi:hypothetical protein